MIDAMLFTGSNFAEVSQFMGPGAAWWSVETGLKIGTLEGDMIASPGDYLIKGVAGEFYPCKPDIFAVTYEPA